jgi:hypothetical protein
VDVRSGVRGRLFPVVTALAGFVVMADAAIELVAAGLHADATATLTPSNERIWIRATISFAVLLVSVAGIVCHQSSTKHRFAVFAAAFLLSASISLFAFEVYWWFAAGSFADLTQKQIPASLWKSYPAMGIARCDRRVWRRDRTSYGPEETRDLLSQRTLRRH